VDVRAVIEFVAAELSQSENCETRGSQASLRVEALEPPITMLHLRFGLAQSFLDDHVGQSGNLLGGFRQGGESGDIAQYNADVFAPLEEREQMRRCGLESARSQPGEVFSIVLAAQRTFQILLAGDSMKKLGILNNGLAQPVAVSENQQGMMKEHAVPIEQSDQ